MIFPNLGHPLRRGLVFDLPLFERGGTTVRELVNNDIGTLTNGPTWVTTPYGAGVRFDGTNDYITMGSNPKSNSLTNNFTVVVIAMPTSASGTTDRKFIANARTTTNNGFSFGLAGPNLRFTTLGVFDYNTSIAVKTDRYQQFIASMKSDNSVDFYVDGIFMQNVTNGTPGTANTDDSLLIGAITNVGGSTIQENFEGDMLQVLIYNRSFTPKDAAQHYANPWCIYKKPPFMQVGKAAAAVASTVKHYLTTLGVGS